MEQTTVRYGSAEERLMFLERAREDARVNELAATNRARREGEREEAVKIALMLKKMGMPTETIKEATGLTTDEILRL